MNRAGTGHAERPSLLGPTLELRGELVAAEELVILGRVSGRRIQAPTITVGPAAQVKAEIHAKSIRIEGVVIGDIYAESSVIVQASASVCGFIHSPQVTIREGAVINGGVNVKAVKEPAGKQSSGPKARTAVRSA